jgi:two-component sensor histidine kinase
VLVEVSIGVAAAFVMVAARVPFEPVAGDRAPYAFNFLAVVIAAVLGGWRSGLVALVSGQLMTWYAIVSPHFSFGIPDNERLGGLVIATMSQALILIVIALYQREVDKGTAERERRMELMDHALNEIDHRTRNNYSTVLAMVHLQAQRSKDPEVQTALQQVADRVQAIATASERLALRSGDIDRVRLDDHLCDLVGHIERGLSREEIEVECDVDDVTASADKATSISIIVNELVTNALKHAFNGQGSGSVSVKGRAGLAFELIVADDGRGIAAQRPKVRHGNGLGTKLVESFVRQLGAKHEVVSTDKGTTHRLVIPTLD